MSTMVETDKEALIRSLLERHYGLQQGGFFSDLKNSDGGIHAASRFTRIPMWNHSVWLDQREEGFDKFLLESTQWLGSRERQPTIYLTSEQDDLVPELERSGFEEFERESWMTFEEASETPDESGEFELLQAASEQQKREFIDLFYSTYAVKEGGYAEMLQQESTDSTGSHEHYLLYRSGKPVSITTVARTKHVAGFYNVGTPPEERRKGYAELLLRRLVRKLLDEGCSTIFLQVEQGGPAEKLYLKLGFKTLFTRKGYRLQNWKRSVERTESTATSSGLASIFGIPEQETIRSEVCWRENKPIPQVLATTLKQAAANASVPVENLLFAAALAAVHRYTGTDHVVLPFVKGESTAASLLRTEVHGAQTGADLAKSVIIEKADLVAATSFDLGLRLQPAVQLQQCTPLARVELVIHSDELNSLQILARTEKLNKDAIRRFATHFLTILGDLAQHPQKTISKLELLSSSEKQQLTVEWNQSNFQPCHTTIQQLFEEQVERSPESVALLFARSGVAGAADELTYRQLNRAANRLAHRLQKHGVGPETMVGVCLGRSLEMIVSLLAIFKAGGACVPLDPAYPPERIAFMVQDTKAPVIITTSDLAKGLPNNRSVVVRLDTEADSLARENEKNPEPDIQPENAAYVIYTSGSTGQPKGVVIPQESIANHAVDCRQHYGLSSRDKALQFSSFNFDASFEQILPALISGATLVVRDDEIWSTKEFCTKLSDLGITVADIPTAYWHQLTEEWHENPSSIPNHSLRLVIVGGEALSPEKLWLWQKIGLENVRLVNAYGPTETTITATSYTLPPESAAEPPMRSVPIGRPRGNRKVYILDQYGNPVPVGVPGELHIGGGMLARGYHNRPELTSSKFIPDPFSDAPDARLYKTGDLTRYLEDGNIEFLGRIDDQVKIRGFRIELGEVENALRNHPAVAETIVLARTGINGEKRLVAYVTADGKMPGERDLRNFLRSRLPEYMVPAAFVILPEWPLLPNGKIDRRALPEPEEQPSEGELTGPRDPVELQLQLVFERVLRRAPIGVDANFFELGGDSLQALELIVEVEKSTGKHLPLGTLYQASTIEELAAEIRQRSAENEWSALVPMQTSGKRPPLYFVHTTPGDILGYGNLVYRLGADQPCYGFQSLGLKESRLSQTSIKQMAKYYVELLLEFQPNGPYHLAGWCYGGVVAVEMARLLRERGEEVGLLGLLETVAMPPRDWNWRYYAHRLNCFFRMAPAQWLVYAREKIRYARESRMANRMRFRQIDNSNRVSPNGEILDPRLAQLEYVYNANLAALKEYRTEFYPGKVTLFNAAERDLAVIKDDQYGWVGLAEEIEIHAVPGNHDTMLTEPNVSVLAQELTDCLEKF